MAGGAGGALILDEATGLPGVIEFPPSTGLASVACTTSLVVRVGGDEVPALAGGLDYPGADELSGVNLEAVEAVEAVRAGTTAGVPAGALEANGRADAWRVRARAARVVIAPRLPSGRRASPSQAGI